MSGTLFSASLEGGSLEHTSTMEVDDGDAVEARPGTIQDGLSADSSVGNVWMEQDDAAEVAGLARVTPVDITILDHPPPINTWRTPVHEPASGGVAAAVSADDAVEMKQVGAAANPPWRLSSTRDCWRSPIP